MEVVTKIAPIALALIMLALGLGLSGQDFLRVIKQPKDFNHDAHSSIFDVTQTQVVKNKFSRVLSWYDNEWGFSNRMCDTSIQISKLI